MRLRNIPGALETLQEHPACLAPSNQTPVDWDQLFPVSQPLHIEIGMGKGQFITTLAAQNPDINYIGMEKYASVLLRAIQKYEEHPYPNLRFFHMDAKHLAEIFPIHSIDQIYLNFSDPWPKDRHAKRRLTSPTFLALYDQILQPDGHIEFKTDNRDLFEFSLEQIEPAGWKLLAHTFDLHHDTSLNQGNIMTEYEEKFSSIGNPICKMIIAR